MGHAMSSWIASGHTASSTMVAAIPELARPCPVTEAIASSRCCCEVDASAGRGRSAARRSSRYSDIGWLVRHALAGPLHSADSSALAIARGGAV